MSSVKPDWSVLPEELLHLISQNLDNGFDAVHARSVCTSWRSTIPFPSCLLRSRYSLPTFPQFPLESKGSFTLEKVPLFLFRVKSPPAASPSEYFLGRISRDESKNHKKLPSPLQCSVKVNIHGVDRAMLNVVDCQVFPLGHQCRMFSWDLEQWRTKDYRGVAFKEGGGGESIVLLNFTKSLFLLRNADMRWIEVELEKFSDASCEDIVPFKGRFYGTILNRDLFLIDPYSLDVTPLMPLQPLHSVKYLIPSDDELFLVEKILPPTALSKISRFACRVSKLDEEAGKWVEVSDVGGRVLFIGYLGNVSCCAKELPDGCGLSGDSLLFIGGPGNVTYSYKYGVNTGRQEDDHTLWRFSGENRVTTINTSNVVAFQVER